MDQALEKVKKSVANTDRFRQQQEEAEAKKKQQQEALDRMTRLGMFLQKCFLSCPQRAFEN